MSIARQFYVLVCLPPFLAIAFAVGLTYQYANLSAQGSRLLNNLRRTEIISERLARGNAEQAELLGRQLEDIDPTFPERLRTLDYEIGDRCTEYLRLDIGLRERLTVERIKSQQAELSLLALRIYRDLENGADRQAAASFTRAHLLEAEVRHEFERLNAAQLETLQAVLAHLDRTATRGMTALAALVAALLLAAAATTVMVRRRVLQPVSAILEASERIRLGDLSARAPAGRRDELGQLTQGFNYMADSLADSYAGLERKVEERTAELERVQGQLVQAEKLSAVGLLVGGVAHELNNPLAGIMGFNQLARMELGGQPGGAEIARLLDQVDAQAERCRRIVGNLLQFARKQEPHLETFEINAAVEQMLQLRSYELSTRHTRLVRDYDPANPVLCADRDKIQQVILNLLNNASDAIDESGKAGTIVVRTRGDGRSVSIEFTDEGPGFRDPARAFDPFYTTKDVGKGTGLGLSVCYGIVREHGGEIVAGNWERGARILVTLPLRETCPPAAVSPAPAPAAVPIVAAPGTPRNVLVVDDEDALARLQSAFLKKMGLEPYAVLSAEEAIRYLEAHHVDLVVSDVRMPGMDGIELYEWVRAHRPGLAGRFLFASGDLVGLDLDDFNKTGAARIDKPFRYEAYARAVLRALGDGSGES